MISGSAPVPSERSAPGWDLLLAVTAGLLLVGQARVHTFVPGAAAVRPGLLLVAAGLAIWILKGRPLARLGTPMPHGVKLGIFVFVWAAVGVPFALWVGQSARGVMESFSTTIVIFLLVAAAVRCVEDVRRLLVIFALGGAVFAVMGPIGGRMGIRGFSAGGFDPNDSAMFLVSALPILVFFAVSARRLRWRVASGLMVLLALGAIVDTQSRGGFLGLAAVLLFMLLFYRGIGFLAKTAAVAAVVIGLMATANAEYWERMETISAFDDGYAQDSEISGRLNIWERGVGYTLENPITGVGLFNFPVAEGRSSVIQARIDRGIGTKYSAAHSMWIQLGAELGIPGILAFLALFGLVSYRMWRISRWRSSRSNGEASTLMASSVLASLIGVAVAGSFLSNAYWAMVWVPLAIGIALDREWKTSLLANQHQGTGIASAAGSATTPAQLGVSGFNDRNRRSLRHLPAGNHR